MTTPSVTLSQSRRIVLAPQPSTKKRGVAVSLLHRLIPEGYEDSSGFHYGKSSSVAALNNDKFGEGICLSDSFKDVNKAVALGPQLAT